MNGPSFANRMIARSDAEAELLIGRVRMFVASILFAAIFLLFNNLPRETFLLRETELKAALVVSGSYFLLGLLSSFLAQSKAYRPIHGLLFALAEVALVLCNVFFDIVDPETSSLFALASPLLLMIALVLVLQVLRYRLWVHIIVSASMIFGLLLLLLHDMQIGEQTSQRAFNELLQMYSLPPNVVRLLMLAILATIIAIAISRSRSLMVRIANELEESQNRNRFLPQELTTHLTDEDIERLRNGRNREVVVMFVDMRGFTRLTQTLSPSQTADLLSEYRSIIMDIVGQHRGIIDKFIGDGVMCVFGLDSSFEQAACDAVESAQEIQKKSADWNRQRQANGEPECEIVIAIGGGEALVAALGPDERLEFTVIGPVVNSVSRMEEHAKLHDVQVLLSSTVHDGLLKKHAEDPCREWGTTHFRGENVATQLWTLDS